MTKDELEQALRERTEERELVPTGRPVGELVCDHGVFCSHECAEEAVEFQEQVRAHLAALQAVCPDCGYDRREHNPACSLVATCSHASAKVDDDGAITCPACEWTTT